MPLTQLLMARTQGNPFFLEESVRTLVETGVLVGERGSIVSTKPLDTLQVPATVQALLAARIDRLPPEDKRLLQTAAAIGMRFPGRCCRPLPNMPTRCYTAAWRSFRRRSFSMRRACFLSAPIPKHALTHEVAYGSLLHEQRRVLHARIVAALEALRGDRRDDQVERLAQHALRGEAWDKALAYRRQAGDKAQTRSAYREAVVFYEQALVALEHVPDSRAATEQAIDLRLSLRTALDPLREKPLSGCSTTCAAPRPPRSNARRSPAARVGLRRHGRQFRGDGRGRPCHRLRPACPSPGRNARACRSPGLGASHPGFGPITTRETMHGPSRVSGRNVATLQGELLSERFGSKNVIVVASSRAWLSRCHAELGAFTEGRAIAEEGLRIAETRPESLQPD